ncbi:ATP-dependent Clp protease proteolytic subunit, partial [Cronobacter sakazakii]
IHNCWVYAMGNRHDLAQIATDMAPFDKAMSDIYQARSGLDAATVDKMMDGETYIGGSEAVEKGFADSLLSADEIADDEESPAAALRKLDALLAKANTPRSERRKLLKALSGSTPGAAATPDGTPGAATIEKETIDRLEAAISGLKAAAQ